MPNRNPPKMIDMACQLCGKVLVVATHAKRYLCRECMREKAKVQAEREREATMSAIELEKRMRDIVEDEIRMPWERKLKRRG